MFIIKYRKVFYVISALLVGASLFAVFFYGLNLSIDFTGGSITEVSYQESPEVEKIKEGLNKLELGNYTLQTIGEKGVILRTKDLKEDERVLVQNVLSLNGSSKMEIKRFDSIGPVIGEELKRKSVTAIFLVIFCIVLFIAFAFRKVSDWGTEKVSSWKYGLVAILALVHDVIIPIGVFVFLGSLFIDYQIDILFVTALLAVLGYSINDTIVVFDRVRENLKLKSKADSFENIVGESLNQVFTRSINTSLTVLIVLIALFFVGGETTKQFALVLIVGVIAGTYSSIFLASPLLVTLQKLSKKI